MSGSVPAGAPASAHGNPFLARLRRVAGMGGEELALLERSFEGERRVRARVDLVPEGTHARHLHVLLSGWACRYKVLADGRRQISLLLVPGDVCDFDALYVQDMDQAVCTLTPCTVATLDGSSLLALAAQRRGVAQALGWLGAVENANLAEQTVRLGRRSARERVAHLFCELSMRLAAAGQDCGDGYKLPLTQEDIGDVLGLTAIHINRVLQMLRAEGMITLQGRELTIPDWNVLKDMGEFQPGYLHIGRPGGPGGARRVQDSPHTAPMRSPGPG